MANPDEELTVAQRLGRALDRGLLPAGGPAEAAERLIERLERPARIALLGLPGSGKSSILNLLVGAIVVPETLRLPTIVVQYGDTPRMICTLTDGSTKILAGSDLAEVLPLAPALVTLEMNLAALKVISLLEVSAGPMEAEQKRAASWASKRADIVIWCTTSYLPKEQVVWESLPDTVKDNSFMFLTKVDLLGSRQSASAMHDRVELRAGEEFRQILSISAKEARAAMPAGGAVNRELFRDSGASAVISAIKTRVQSGRRADMDTAELLLARHVEASELVARRFAEPGEATEAPAPWAPPPEAQEPEVAAEVEDVEVEPVEVEDVEVEETEDVAELTDETVEPVHEDDWADDDATDAVDGDEDLGADLPELETEPEPEPAPEPEPEPTPVIIDPMPVAAAEPEIRRRFADRIKRVAGDGETAAAPMMPLRSTWKSKAESGAAPEPEPEPAPRPPEPVRRPRPTAQPTTDESDLARMLADITAAPLPDLDPVPDEVPEAAPEIVPEAPVRPRERTGRAVTPRPERSVETPVPQPSQDDVPDASESEPRKVFGARRPPVSGLTRGSPLPDLSSLRARPDEMEDEGEAEEAALVAEEAEFDLPDVAELTPEAAETFEEVAEPDPVEEPEPAADPLPKVAAPAERPRLFNREPRRPAGPVAPPPEQPRPRDVPVQRLPASARAPAPPPVAAAAPALDEAQFSPRAIMMRDRRVEEEHPTQRRERTRVAARAVPTAAAPAAPLPDIGADSGLADEAIAVIVARAADLESEIDFAGKVPVDLILEHTRETGEQVMAVVARGRSDAMRRINSDLGEVLDLIMLMQLEKGHAPADDALTVLLQLRRELETLRAV